MRTPSREVESVEHDNGNASHPLQLDVDQDQNQINLKISPVPGTAVQTPNVKKSTVIERLRRISKYRIRPTAVQTNGKPSGRGGKGEVVRATFKRNKDARGRRVAAKKLLWNDDEEVQEKFFKELVHEVELLAKLSHKNVVRLIGFVEDFKHQKAWIVLSWEPNGNVREFLASGKWEIPERISLIQDMFNGLQYLHTREPPICHGDLKSLNILVSSSYHAIITDFGSARLMNERIERKVAQNTTRNAGRVQTGDQTTGSSHARVTITVSANQLTFTGPDWTLRWAAPELLVKDEPPSLASDVWSAGWVCWEMMTDRIPFDDIQRDPAIVLNVIEAKLPPIHEDAQLAQVFALCSMMRDCWKFEPENRPQVSQCCKEVEWMPSVPPLGVAPSGTKEPSAPLLLAMANLHSSHNRPEKAAQLLEQIVNNAKSVSKQDVAGALIGLGDVYQDQSRYTDAEKSYTRAQRIYARLGEDMGRADTIQRLGDVYCAQSRYTEAGKLYTRAQKIYSRNRGDLGQANTILGLGQVYTAQARYNEAEESYRRAEEIYTRIGYDQGRATAFRGLGDIYRDQARYNEAEESYRRAEDIYTRIGYDLGRAATFQRLGHVYHAQLKYTEAEESYTRAERIYTRFDEDLSPANTVQRLGHVYSAQFKYTETEEFYTQAEEIYARIGEDIGHANRIRGLVDIYRDQFRYNEAEESYTRTQELFSRLNDDIWDMYLSMVEQT
ncbi:hypothetical protein M407DRAFT_24325 [Tulasnella calospora MUT 4182]|uniref:Protein kinase domain-containing protein n=1 Tax=Tulasnella calospora MUT 4182 TaxID=1051891 RepID=A0A0C3QJJ8_9AGAM|nr:hypothetical protein M407DRAFT_24325 [Tulasnella calospora MUT 4182]